MLRQIVVAMALSLLAAGAAFAGAAPGPALSVPSDRQEQPADAASVRLALPSAHVAADEAAITRRVEEMTRRFPPADFEPEVKAKELGGAEPIFRFVRDSIRFEAYPGVLRGAKGAYLARAANAPDRSLLLAQMLAAAGVPCRFALGRLPGEKCQILIGRMFEPGPLSAGPGDKAPAGAGSAGGDFLDRVRARARRDYAVIRAALRDRSFDAAEPDRPQMMGEIASHVWVQARIGADWVDLDSAFPDAAPGKTYCAVQTTAAALPDEMFQKGTIRVVVERLDGASLRQETTLELTRPVVDLVGRQIFLLHAPESGLRAVGRAISGAGKDDWLAALLINDEIETGKLFAFNDQPPGQAPPKGGVEDVLSALTTEPPKQDAAPRLVAEYLDLAVTAPGGKTETTRRVLFDCGTAAWRRALPLDPKALKPLDRDEHGPVAAQAIRNIWFSAGPHDLWAYTKALQALAEVGRPATAPSSAPPPSLPPPEESEMEPARALWPLAMQDYACVLWGDQAFLPALNDDPQVRMYLASPRILLFTFSVRTPAEAPDRLAVDSEIDLCRDVLRGVSRDGRSSAAVAARKIWFGVLEGALEHEMAAQEMVAVTKGTGIVSSTSALLDAGGVVTLDRASADRPWEQLAAERETAARLAGTLSAGSIAVVPRRVLQGGESGWWAVSGNGDTRAVLGRDMSGGKFGVGGNYIPRGASSGSAGAGVNNVDPNTGRGMTSRKALEYLTLVLNIGLPGARVLRITITPALRSVVFEVIPKLLP